MVDPAPKGASIIAAIKAAGVDYVLSVPDVHTSFGLLWPIVNDPTLRLIRTCKEDECLGIASGLAYADKRALVLIQYTGLFYAMNAIRAVAVSLQQPICMMVGLLAKEPGVPPRQSRQQGISSIEPILDAMGVDYHELETEADVPLIAPAIKRAYETSRPVAILVGQSPT